LVGEGFKIDRRVRPQDLVCGRGDGFVLLRADEANLFMCLSGGSGSWERIDVSICSSCTAAPTGAFIRILGIMIEEGREEAEMKKGIQKSMVLYVNDIGRAGNK